MRVLITGGTGSVGKAITERLIQHSWDVRVIGIESEAQLQGAEYACCDILDYAALREQMRGCQMVVHLAAIPNPRMAPGSQTFQVNTAGTFNVFEAAAAEGIKRIVQASSINAFGCAWGIVDMDVRSFPIDEAHPTFTTDVYSFSKQMIEDIGDYYWRREGISSLALRFPWVTHTDQFNSEQARQGRQTTRAALDVLVTLPEDEQRQRLEQARARALEFRGQRRMEYPAKPPMVSNLSGEDLLWKIYTFDRFNLWAIVDNRDSAQAMEKGLQAEFEGSHALFINSAYNSLGYDSQTLARLFFPQVSEWKRPVPGTEALVSIDRARALIGFEPEYSIEI